MQHETQYDSLHSFFIVYLELGRHILPLERLFNSAVQWIQKQLENSGRVKFDNS